MYPAPRSVRRDRFQLANRFEARRCSIPDVEESAVVHELAVLGLTKRDSQCTDLSIRAAQIRRRGEVVRFGVAIDIVVIVLQFFQL